MPPTIGIIFLAIAVFGLGLLIGMAIGKNDMEKKIIKLKNTGKTLKIKRVVDMTYRYKIIAETPETPESETP